MWEYLSLYAERDDNQECFFVKNYPEPRTRNREDELLARLGAEGWELVAVTPAFSTGTVAGNRVNHQLYLKRRGGAAAGWDQETTRLAR